MEFAAGTVVVETTGFFAGVRFTVTGEYTGTNERFGEKRLFAPEIPKEDVKAAKALARQIARDAALQRKAEDKKLKAELRLAKTAFETLKRETPEALTAITEHYLKNNGRIEVCCAPRHVEKVAAHLSSMTSLSELDAEDYIRVVTEASQGPKYDIVMQEGAGFSETATAALGLLLWGEKYSTKQRGFCCNQGEIQVNSKALASWLMKECGALPVCSDYRKVKG
jgi:hypothetical protein